MKYKRILLKLSGEALVGEKSGGIDPEILIKYSHEIKKIYDKGVEIAIVIGGGNIYRGFNNEFKIDRVQGDYMGMLATLINGLALQNTLENIGIPTRLQSAINVNKVAEPYIKRKALRHLDKKRIVIFSAGTGNPYFTTDTAAALRASEMNCEVIIKATLVDGVYSADPKKDKNAIKYNNMSYLDVLSKDLKVMDASAISLARENKIPIVVCSIVKNQNLSKVLSGKGSYTIISD